MPKELGDDDYLLRLGRLDCCAVSDALDKLGLPASVSSLGRLATDKRIAGRVVTVKLVAAADQREASATPKHLGATAIEAASSGDVIVVEQRTGITAGSWGGILTLGAKLRGIAGVISDGLVRDLDEARAYDFPVFARGSTARTARSRVVEAYTNQPICIDEVTVAPGDYVVADASGVAFIPAGQIAPVLDAAEMIAGREAAMTKSLLSSQPIGQVMGADYEHMLR
ncbi:RraA family protein [Pigmentiphaga kullae]|uniref:Putative 4-hydroxy-4-methyl-2-oxoglutarate aldolase n=1 Tax=Pigmentiphaga kullae TaxID=151784 RepID=A0A4Q7NNT9_9BURK|nr:RraA family protein [Pigmentiphaga kullae]RZS86616.1 regulator of RNase E activity RraA [Pigmentiphaga kullae]